MSFLFKYKYTSPETNSNSKEIPTSSYFLGPCPVVYSTGLLRVLYKQTQIAAEVINWANDHIRSYTTVIIYGIAIAAIFISFIPIYNGSFLSLQGTALYDAFYSNTFQVTAIASVAVTWSGLVDCMLDLASGTAVETDMRERFILLLCLAYPNAFAVYCYQFGTLKGSAVEIFAILKILHEVLYLAPCCVIAFQREHKYFNPLFLISLFLIYTASCVLKVNSLGGPYGTIIDLLLYIPYCIAVIFILLFWYRLYASSRTKRLTANSINLGVISICLVLLALALQIINVATKQMAFLNYGPVNLSVSLLMRIVFTIAVTVLPGRLSSLLLKEKRLQLDMKSLFVRYVSHEIRTPMNIAVAGLDVLMRTKKRSQTVQSSEEELDLIDEIQDSCKVAVTILDDLLAYEKLDSGILALDKSEVNVSAFVRTTAALFRIQAKGKNITMSLLENEDRVKDTLVCEMDQGKMAQVLRNFISNAIKFTPENGIVKIHAFVRLGDPASVVIQVIDSGVGLTPVQLGKIFNEIIQFNANKLQGGGGSGLGLWVSKKIVDLHEGRVKVMSEGPGHGCVFEIALPMSVTENHHRGSVGNNKIVAQESADHVSLPLEKSSLLGSSVSGSADDSDLIKNLHCLVVDDSKLNRKVMMRLLATCDYSAEEVEDGAECVDVIKKSFMGDQDDRFDVILMDNQMPNMTGPEAAGALRALGYMGVVVGVTGNALVEDVNAFIISGADDVLIKPITADKLEECLMKIMKKKKKARADLATMLS